jgi:hypothetical protein
MSFKPIYQVIEGIHCLYVPSIEKLREYAKTQIGNGFGRGSQRIGKESFFGTPSYKEALDNLIGGWPLGVEYLQELTKKLSKEELFKDIMPYKSFAHEYNPCLIGECLDITRAIADQSPEHFSTEAYSEELKHGNRFISLIINYFPIHVQSQENIHYIGALFYSLIEFLESKGFRLEIFLMCQGLSFMVDNLSILNTLWKIKSLEDNISLEDIATTLGMTAFYRRIGFAVWESLPQELHYKFGIGSRYTNKPGFLHTTEEKALAIQHQLSGEFTITDKSYIIGNYSKLTNNETVKQKFIEDIKKIKLTEE